MIKSLDGLSTVLETKSIKFSIKLNSPKNDNITILKINTNRGFKLLYIRIAINPKYFIYYSRQIVFAFFKCICLYFYYSIIFNCNFLIFLITNYFYFMNFNVMITIFENFII